MIFHCRQCKWQTHFALLQDMSLLSFASFCQSRAALFKVLPYTSYNSTASSLCSNQTFEVCSHIPHTFVLCFGEVLVNVGYTPHCYSLTQLCVDLDFPSVLQLQNSRHVLCVSLQLLFTWSLWYACTMLSLSKWSISSGIHCCGGPVVGAHVDSVIDVDVKFVAASTK